MTLRKVTNGDQSKPHKSSKGVSGSLIFEQFLWPTPITFEGLSLCRWIHLIKVFSMILMMSSLEFWYASGVFFLSLLFHSCNFLNDMREREREKKAGKKERYLIDTLKLQWQHHQYHIKDLDKTNQTTPKKTMKGNHIGPHEPPKGRGDSLGFERLVWFT